jgi:hypothetical protein
MVDVVKVADAADVIIDGYAITRCDSGFRVLNLNNPEKAAFFLENCSIAETTMDDIELQIASDYLKRSIKYMED